MSKELVFDYGKCAAFVSEGEMENMKAMTLAAREQLLGGTGAGNDFLGWVDLPENYDKEEFARIKKAAEKIQGDSDVLLVIGIGGSYLGARAAIEFLNHCFYNVVPRGVRKAPEIYFLGTNISSSYIKDLTDVLEGKDFSINVISKSGTTTEPAIAFRIFKELIEKKYGRKEAAKRIYATTDKARGALKTLATEEGYETFVVPDDVGGRFSVLTAVGLLPIAVSGADLDRLMAGAQAARKQAIEAEFEKNNSLLYAAMRNILLRKGKNIEITANYEPALHYVAEWWKQLYGESDGRPALDGAVHPGRLPQPVRNRAVRGRSWGGDRHGQGRGRSRRPELPGRTQPGFCQQERDERHDLSAQRRRRGEHGRAYPRPRRVQPGTAVLLL